MIVLELIFEFLLDALLVTSAESKIGQFILKLLGIIVISVGFTFLISQAFNNELHILILISIFLILFIVCIGLFYLIKEGKQEPESI